jgi:glycerol-3-phosphate acyltransferase PlsY
MDFLQVGALVLVAFLMGSVPFGFLVGKMRGVDVRKAGSGNIGATNVGRVCGKGWGYLVLFLDFSKAWLAVWGLVKLGVAVGWAEDSEMLRVLLGVAAVLGHNFCPWLGFKGGKGVASTAGILVGISPVVFLFALAAFVVFYLATNYVSAGSIAAAVAMAVSAWIFSPNDWAAWAMTVLAAMAIVKHRGNISRMIAGTESKTLPPWCGKAQEEQK